MYKIFTLLLLFGCLSISAQDITGTWEGELIKDGGPIEAIQRRFKMKWEIVQIEKEVYGTVYFFPQDARATDLPNNWYSWYGKLGKKKEFPFQFIQGRYMDGMGATSVYQFNVRFEKNDSMELLSGNYFTQLEALNSGERPTGFYRLKKISSLVSDHLWLKRKEKEIINKLNKQKL
ncbi:MAG: hypothetical protein ACKVOW_03005 [Chitinophagaceae bacterium]